MRSQSELLGQQIEFRPAFDTCPFHFPPPMSALRVEEVPLVATHPTQCRELSVNVSPFPVGHVLLLPDVSTTIPFTQTDPVGHY